MDDTPVGRRVAYWRQRRNMSQQIFADRLGKSKSWVDKVERGVRRLDKFSVLFDIAAILQVDMQLLMGRDARRRPESINCVDQVEVEEIRAALERYDRIGALLEPLLQEPPSLEDLDKSVRHAWMTFQHAKYGVLARTLPRLLRDAQAADAICAGDAAVHAAGTLTQVYQIAASTLRKLGEFELAWLAGDRGMAAAQRSGDALLVGTGTYRVANALLSIGRARPALDLNVTVAQQLAPETAPTVSPEQLSVYGILLLQGAMAAARAGDTATVKDLFKEADVAAERLGGDYNHYWTSFGPTNVKVHRAAAAVELGEGHIAVQVESEIDPAGLASLAPERRANHMLDVARGHVQVGNLDRATQMLLEADRLAPSEIRCRPIAHEVLTDVLRRNKGPVGPLRDLADHMGVAS